VRNAKRNIDVVKFHQDEIEGLMTLYLPHIEHCRITTAKMSYFPTKFDELRFELNSLTLS